LSFVLIIAQVEEVLKSLKIQNPEILNKTMDYLKAVNKGRAHEYHEEVGAIREEHTKVQNKLDELVDLVADRTLTREEFTRKKQKLRDRQHELSELLKTYDKFDDKFSKKLVELINITQNAYKTFKGSKIDEKREWLKFLFSNLELKGQKLLYELAFPFNHLAKVANCPTWRTGWDSNPRCVAARRFSRPVP
jgi:myosin heavy subunit